MKKPKNGIMDKKILGDFGYPWLIPAIWNKAEQQWVGSVVHYSVFHGEDDAYFENEYFNDEELLSWMLAPEYIPKKESDNMDSKIIDILESYGIVNTSLLTIQDACSLSVAVSDIEDLFKRPKLRVVK